MEVFGIHIYFAFIDEGIGLTGSTAGAFRMKNDVFTRGKPDLLFVEAAVNDYNIEPDPVRHVRGMEGAIRQVRIANPNMDIVMLHFICDAFLPLLKKGQMPDVILSYDLIDE